MVGKVVKFGGTSLGDASRIARAADAVVVARSEGPVAVVVSAMAGVTNRLAGIAELAVQDAAAAAAAARALVASHADIAAELGAAPDGDLPWTPARIGRQLDESLPALAAGDAAARDILLASGEKLAAWLLLGVVQARGVAAAIVPAEVLVRTSGRHGNAEVDRTATSAAIAARGAGFWQGLLRIVPGFTGASPDGRTTTLGRNASDYSAALLAAALGWPLEIWTDVAGCYSADPRLVAGARLLRHLSLADANRFAHAGASVIHARTLEPLLERPVPLTIVNSFASDAQSTRIGGEVSEPLRGLALRHDLSLARGARALTAAAAFDQGDDVYADAPAAVVAVSEDGAETAVPVALLSVFDDTAGASLPHRCREALAASDLVPLALWWSRRERCVRIALAAADGQPALRALHRLLIAGDAPVPIHLAVIGASGRVGRRLLELVAEQRPSLRARGFDLRVVAAVNSRKAVVDAAGIEPAAVGARLAAANEATLAQWSHDLLARPERPLVLVDCTASADVAARYPDWLAAGIDIVTPNKHGPSAAAPLAGAIAEAQRQSGARLLHETTVGAQLPLLRTLRELTSAGDRVETLEAVLSGTLSYVLGRLQQDVPFSAAVREAVALGYAEPHPGADLSGADAARKLVILLRALGVAIDLDEIHLQPLVDAERLREPDAGRLLDTLEDQDAPWQRAAEAARAAGECWIYRASWQGGIAQLRAERVPLSHPLARLLPCENALRLSSSYYRAAPLTVAGPGAGIDLTAAGVFADLLEVIARHQPVEPLRQMPAGAPLRAVA
ncbi:Aspartokinase I ThrA [Dokdonella koreensis DS-123]|uniref:Aspartokinase I ThrA n=1 Tax=Dokdonella koreensis DS-123 TaxID=1300342 RepID=A0A160DSJ6_9GAMM|nr:Aspartokinase I ThrA [Dokdonella koreensis DS-123]